MSMQLAVIGLAVLRVWGMKVFELWSSSMREVFHRMLVQEEGGPSDGDTAVQPLA